MIEALASRWWIFLVRGIAAILFGVVAIAWPGISLVALTMLFGAFAFVDGVMAFGFAFTGAGGSRWWALVIEGLVGLGVAFFVLSQPGLSAVSLVYAVAVWAVFTGVIEIIAGVQFRDFLPNDWTYVLAGALSIVFGVLVMRNPIAGGLAIMWIIAFYSILFGLMEVFLSRRIKRLG